MRDDRPSLTAAWVAAARQLGGLLPAGDRLADDPYGVAFVSPTIAGILRRPGLPRRAVGQLVRSPLLAAWVLYMQLRTRVLDDAVRAFVAGGGRQLVILGAGYDCRALRLPELAASLVVEVDHPATQGRKRSILAQEGAASPARYLPWDFETSPVSGLPAALGAVGLDRGAPTLTIWEGVTMYLTEPAIDATVHAIAAYSAPGSQLAMTYFRRSRIEHPSLPTRAMAAVVARLGEPFRFGWEPGELPAWLAARGFHLDRDVPIADAARQLLPTPRGRLDDLSRRIALASVQQEAETIGLATRST
jgi:methyltransferase (TIGR00027 family)